MSPVQVQTRTVAFRDFETWVRITTPATPRPNTHPLVVLHGGPGMAHDYVRNIGRLADETGRTVIHYDQLGCGHSTHLPDAPADFWTAELFVDEFAARSSTRLGHRAVPPARASPGAACSAPRSSVATARGPGSPVDLQLPGVDAALGRRPPTELRAELPAEIQAALDRHEAAGTVTDPEYLAATRGLLRPPRLPRRAHTRRLRRQRRRRWRPSRPSTTR